MSAAEPCTVVFTALRSASARTLHGGRPWEGKRLAAGGLLPRCSLWGSRCSSGAGRRGREPTGCEPYSAGLPEAPPHARIPLPAPPPPHRLSGEASPLMGRRRPASVATPPSRRAAAVVASMKAATPLKCLRKLEISSCVRRGGAAQGGVDAQAASSGRQGWQEESSGGWSCIHSATLMHASRCACLRRGHRDVQLLRQAPRGEAVDDACKTTAQRQVGRGTMMLLCMRGKDAHCTAPQHVAARETLSL